MERHAFFWERSYPANLPMDDVPNQPPDDCPCLECGRTFGELMREAYQTWRAHVNGETARQPVPEVYERAFAGRNLQP